MMSNTARLLPTIAILAPGLLGASLAMASKRKGLCGQVHVWARREETRRECASQWWCDSCWENIEDSVKDADLIWVCAPVVSIPTLVGRIAAHLKEGAIVSDVGSTKEKLIRQAEIALDGKGIFVGSHPMAGSEKSGNEFASEDLYEGKPCFVTPLESTDSVAVETVKKYWSDLGMNVHVKTPKEHDKIVAHISHLPHVLASTLSAFLEQNTEAEWTQFAGTGLMDTTRVAAGSVNMWMDIISHNKDQIYAALNAAILDMEHLKVHLESGRMDVVQDVLEKGKAYRDSIDKNVPVSEL